MACVVGYEAYRWEMVDHAVPVRLIGPDGRQLRHLSKAASRVFEQAGGGEKGKRWLNAFKWTLDVAHATMPDAAERYEAGLAQCRSAQDRFIVALGIKSRDSRHRDGSVWLTPRKEMWGKVSDALIAMGLVTSWLSDELYGGEDPSKVDLAVSRVFGVKAQAKAANSTMRSDVDRRFRLGSNPAHAPRFDDPRFYDRWVGGLQAIGAPEVFERIGDMGRHAGARAFQALALTLHDVFCRAEVEGEIPGPNKGSAGERSMVFMLPDSRWAALLKWIDGARRRATDLSLAKIRAMAANPREAPKLKTMFLFTEAGGREIKYDRLYRVFRKAAERADLYIADAEFRETGRKRFVTFHLLRHEYVHHRLDVADAMEPLARTVERRSIIWYMKWKQGEQMLAWYSAHHVVKVARGAAIRFNKMVDGATAGANVPTGVVDDRAGRSLGSLLAGLV